MAIVSGIADKRRDRLALRASSTFFLRSADLLARVVGGDILRAVIFLAIVEANIRHLRPSDSLAQAFSETGQALPDEVRNPISIHALALALSLPYETTRRHVNTLIADGMTVRLARGVIVPTEVLDRDALVTAMRKNFEHLRELYEDLSEGGVGFAVSKG